MSFPFHEADSEAEGNVSSPKSQQKIVEEIGYKASPYHRETRDLLESLGLSPVKPALTNAKLEQQLKEITKTENLEALTFKRASLLLEERLDVTLSASQKQFIRERLMDLVEEAIHPPKKQKQETEEAEVGISQPTSTTTSEKVASTQETYAQETASSLPCIPLIIPKSLGISTTPFLIEMTSEKSLDLSGDTGAVGRLSIVAADGKRHTVSPEKSKGKQDLANIERYKKGSFVRLDMKGDVFHGILAQSKVTACAVSIGSEEAKVNGICNEFIQASFQKNILGNIYGEMIEGKLNHEDLTFHEELDVNEQVTSFDAHGHKQSGRKSTIKKKKNK